MANRMDSKPYWMCVSYIEQGIADIYAGKFDADPELRRGMNELQRTTIATAQLRTATPMLSRDWFDVTIRKMQYFGDGLYGVFDTRSKEFYPKINHVIRVTSELDRCILEKMDRPAPTQAEIEDYAARCANKAYEEAIYRATHGLVTVEEMRHVA